MTLEQGRSRVEDTLSSEAIQKCPKRSFEPSHYNDDGSCQCPLDAPSVPTAMRDSEE